MKQNKSKKRKQSYIWDITYKDLEKGGTFVYGQQSTTKEKAIKLFKNYHKGEKVRLISIKLNETYPTPEDLRSLERAELRASKMGFM